MQRHTGRISEAAAVGLAVPAVVAGYLLVAGLATAILAAAPGAVDFVTTVRPAGGRGANKAICHAVLGMGSLALFALAWFLRRDLSTAPALNVLLLELLAVAQLMISGLFGGSLVLERLRRHGGTACACRSRREPATAH